MIIKENKLTTNILDFWCYDKNDVSLDHISEKSRKELYFKCKKGHEFTDTLKNINRRKNKNVYCPVCENKDKKIYLFKKYPHLIKNYLKDDNKLPHEKITSGMGIMVNITCDKGHKIRRRPKDLVKKGTILCGVCAGVVVTEENRLDKKNPELLSEWNYKKNKKKPENYAHNSNKKVHWICEHNHEWFQEISARTGTRYKNKTKTKCPHCYSSSKSRNELIIYSELKFIFGNVETSYKNERKELDVFIEDLNLGIEYDGFFWHKEKYEKDLEKNNHYKEINIKVLRIRESKLEKINKDDFIYDVNDSIYRPILYILKFILKNYKLDIELEKRIRKYIFIGKIQNTKFLEKIIDKKRIKKIDRLRAFECYSKKNKLDLIYYGKGSDYKAFWECNHCGHEWQAKVRQVIRRKNICLNCKK